MKSSSILTEAQRKALVSPARIEIVECILHLGPQPVARIGKLLGRAPDSLYYHLKRLVKVGILKESRNADAGQRGETTYEATARGFHSECDPGDPESVEIERAGLGALLRLTERTYSRALGDPQVRTHGKQRDVEARRTRVYLDAKGRAELNRRVDELFEFLIQHATSTTGRATCVTMVLCPSDKR